MPLAAVILAFLSTNVDGFLCLGAAFAIDPPRSRSRAIAAAAAAFVLLLGISFAGSLAIHRLGVGAQWFGLVPAGIGVARLARFIFRRRAASAPDWLSSAPSIFAITLATGFDNVAVYTPLFALHPFSASLTIAAAYLLAWVLGCGALAFASPSVQRVHALERYLEPVFAVLFIAVGLEIVAAS